MALLDVVGVLLKKTDQSGLDDEPIVEPLIDVAAVVDVVVNEVVVVVESVDVAVESVVVAVEFVVDVVDIGFVVAA